MAGVCAVACVATDDSDSDHADGLEGGTEQETWEGPLTGLDETANTPHRVPDPDGDDGDTDSDGQVGLCGRALDQNVGIAGRETTVSLLRGDRSERQLLLLEVPPLPPDSYLSTESTLRDDMVVVTVEWTIPGDVYDFGTAIEVFEPDGSPRWGLREDGVSFGSPRIGADESVAVSRVTGEGDLQMVLFDRTGSSSSVDNFHAREGKQPNGLVPGYFSDEFEFSPGWMDPKTGDFQPVSLLSSNAIFVDGRIVYLTATSVIDERPDGFEEYHVTTGEQIYLASLSLPWMLVSISGEQRWARVSLDTGEVEPVELEPPPGSVTFDCFFIDPTIDAEGGILFPTRDEYAATLTRYDPTTDKYSYLGSKRIDIEELSGYSVRGTHFVDGLPPGFGFCDPQTWEPSDEDLLGAGLEVFRPELGFRMFIEDSFNHWVSSDSSGTCLILGSSSTTEIVDLLTGAKHDLGVPTGFQFPLVTP